jgi:hypothetical protein
MKRIMVLIVALIFLAGCGAPGISPSSALSPPKPAAETTNTGGDLLSSSKATSSPTDMTTEDPTPEPEPTEEPIPTPMYTDTPYENAPSTTSAFPPIANKKALPGLEIGTVATEKGSILYYVEMDNNSGFDGCTIYKLDRAINKKTVLRQTDTNIKQIFLDTKGNLYYVRYTSNDPEYFSSLYEYNGMQDKLIASHIDTIGRVDCDAIYYSTILTVDAPGGQSQLYYTEIMKYTIADGSASRLAQFPSDIWLMNYIKPRSLLFFNFNYLSTFDEGAQTYSYDLTNNTNYKVMHVNERFIFSDDGDNLVVYVPSKNKTTFTIYNFKTLTKKAVTVKEKIDNLGAVLLASGHFYVSGNSGSGEYPGPLSSTVFDIDITTGDILSKTPLDYIGESALYQGKWFLYTYLDVNLDDGEHYLAKQAIRVFDSTTNHYSVVAALGKTELDNDESLTFEVCGGYIWMIKINGCEGASYSCWKRIAIPAGKPPSPTPEPTAT